VLVVLNAVAAHKQHRASVVVQHGSLVQDSVSVLIPVSAATAFGTQMYSLVAVVVLSQIQLLLVVVTVLLMVVAVGTSVMTLLTINY
jgi:hypothetical protein